MKMRTFPARNQYLTHGKFEIASLCSFHKCQTSRKAHKTDTITQVEEHFVQDFLKNMIAWLARAQQNGLPRQKQTDKTNEKTLNPRLTLAFL